jgi:hypothetical protein
MAGLMPEQAAAGDQLVVARDDHVTHGESRGGRHRQPVASAGQQPVGRPRYPGAPG